MNVFLKKWDCSKHLKRVALLQGFFAKYSQLSYRDIEQDFGPSGDLFFTRVTAALRLL